MSLDELNKKVKPMKVMMEDERVPEGDYILVDGNQKFICQCRELDQIAKICDALFFYEMWGSFQKMKI